MFLTFGTTAFLGTVIMTLGPVLEQRWSWKRSHSHELLPATPGPSFKSSADQEWKEEKEKERVKKKERRLVMMVFLANYTVCQVAALWSAWTSRLNPSTGLDWEVWEALLVVNCTWQLIQAVLAVWSLPLGKSFSVTTFAEGLVQGTAPVVSDPFDTFKDNQFGGLCLCSHLVWVKVLGVLSLLYLLAVHIYLILFDDCAGELRGSFLGVLYSPTRSAGTAKDDRSFFEKVLLMLYKQTTPKKRKILRWENIPQAAAGILYAVGVGGSMLVVFLNVLVPMVQLFLGLAFYKTLQHQVVKSLAQQMARGLEDNDVSKIEETWDLFRDDPDLFYKALASKPFPPSLEKLTLNLAGTNITDVFAANLKGVSRQASSS